MDSIGSSTGVLSSPPSRTEPSETNETPSSPAPDSQSPSAPADQAQISAEAHGPATAPPSPLLQCLSLNNIAATIDNPGSVGSALQARADQQGNCAAAFDVLSTFRGGAGLAREVSVLNRAARAGDVVAAARPAYNVKNLAMQAFGQPSNGIQTLATKLPGQPD